jgi:hypothetical protein
MYTNTVLSTASCAVPGPSTTISCPSSTTTPHVSASQGPSSGVYVDECKLLLCGHTNHALCTKLIVFVVFKIKKKLNS